MAWLVIGMVYLIFGHGATCLVLALQEVQDSLSVSTGFTDATLLSEMKKMKKMKKTKKVKKMKKMKMMKKMKK